MTQEDKQLLLVDLCGRLPYGVKLLVEGWDSDRGCEFDTVETLIGIDDRFIYTIWDKTGDKGKHSIVEPLSILDYKPYLRPLSSMTDEEYEEFGATRFEHQLKCLEIDEKRRAFETGMKFDADDLEYLYSHHYDVRGLIPMGLAESIEKFNPYKE